VRSPQEIGKACPRPCIAKKEVVASHHFLKRKKLKHREHTCAWAGEEKKAAAPIKQTPLTKNCPFFSSLGHPAKRGKRSGKPSLNTTKRGKRRRQELQTSQERGKGESCLSLTHSTCPPVPLRRIQSGRKKKKEERGRTSHSIEKKKREEKRYMWWLRTRE